MLNLVSAAVTLGLVALPVAIIILLNAMLCRLLMPTIVSSCIGRWLYFSTAAVGTPIHELSHYTCAKLCGHKVTKLVLFRFNPADGRLGYVEHAYTPSSVTQTLGLIPIGLAPLFGGMAAIAALTELILPSTDYFAYLQATTQSATQLNAVGVLALMSQYGQSNLQFIAAVAPQPWAMTWLTLTSLIAFHAIPSRADLGAVTKGTLLLSVVLAVVVLTLPSLWGQADLLIVPLLRFMAALMGVVIFSLFWWVPLWLISKVAP